MINFLFFVSILLLSNPVYAYLDPGSASIILQIIFSSIATIFAFVGIYYLKLKNLLKKFFRKKKNKIEKYEDK